MDVLDDSGDASSPRVLAPSWSVSWYAGAKKRSARAAEALESGSIAPVAFCAAMSRTA